MRKDFESAGDPLRSRHGHDGTSTPVHVAEPPSGRDPSDLLAGITALNGGPDHRRFDVPQLSELIASLDWALATQQLDAEGFAVIGPVLSPDECHALAASYGEADQFRSHVVMARHGFGRGEYKYFSNPLPPIVSNLRAALYPPLATIANRWSAAQDRDALYPLAHEDFLQRCHRAGQTKPTPLLLKYGEGDYNCLHQDVYGERVFPLQVAILLSDARRDFSGGEFVLTEQRPRMQSRAAVVPLGQGQGVIFPVRHRPVAGRRGPYRVTMRHGVSRIHAGQRYTLGIIFHDAE